MLGKLMQRGAKKVISYGDSYISITSGSPTPITIPSTAKVGDIIGIVLILAGQSQTVTPPAGWTNFENQVSSGSYWSQAYSKICAVGDPGSTINFTNSGSAVTAICFVYKNAKSFPVHSGWMTSGGNTGASPSITTNKANALVVVIWLVSGFQTTVGAPTMPSGVTQRALSNQQYGGVVMGDFKQVVAGATGQKNISTMSNVNATAGWQIQLA